MKNKLTSTISKPRTKSTAVKTFKSYLLFTNYIKEFDRVSLALIHDIFITAIAIPLALWIRVGDEFNTYSSHYIFKNSLVYVLLAIGVFLWLQIYRGVWRYVSVKEVIAISMASFSVSILYTPLMFLISANKPLPRSVIVISWLIVTGMLCFSRVMYRSFHERWGKDTRADFTTVPQSRVLLIGSTSQAEAFIRDMQSNSRALYEVVGIIDHKKGRVGRHIRGVEIMGVIHDLPNIISQLDLEGRHPHHIVITDPYFKQEQSLRQLLQINSNFKVDLAKLPDLHDAKKLGPYGIEIKPIQIEDLLKRKYKTMDHNAVQQLIKNQCVMITGAGGTIGKELARQIAECQPHTILLVDHAEFMLHSIDRELEETFPHISRRTILADVTDHSAINDIFQQHKPHLVFHAAALKQIYLTEVNICQTILTNIIGTRNIAEACQKYNVKAMVLISTDKAVLPSSIMGATKRVAELLCQVINKKDQKKYSTHFIISRFGNVCPSSGSVVALFEHQLSQGGPLTVTHPEIKRYFMSLREAVELVLEATILGLKTDKISGHIFIPDMGEPIKILELAEQMIQLAGLKPHEDVNINFIGLRPGEKLIEELFLPNEKLMQTSCEALMLATSMPVEHSKILDNIKIIEALARNRQTNKAIEKLTELVPDYTRSDTDSI